MDVQKTLALSLSVVNLLLFFGSSMYYNQSFTRLTAELKRIEEMLGAVEKQLVSHVAQSVGSTNTRVSDMKRQIEDAQRASASLKAQIKAITQTQTAQIEQLVAMLQSVEGIKEDDRKKLLQLVKQPPAPPARRTVRFEDEDDVEDVRPARRRAAPVEDDEDEEESTPTRRRAADDDDDDDVEKRLAAVRRRKQRS